MKFVITVLKLIFSVFLGVVLLYILESVRCGEFKNFLYFMKIIYPGVFFAVLMGMLAKEKIDH